MDLPRTPEPASRPESPGARRRSARRTTVRLLEWLAVGAVLVLAMLYLRGTFRERGVVASEPSASRLDARSRTATARETDLPLVETFEGVVRSARTSLLAAQVSGTLRTLLPRVGEAIVPGATVGTLDPAQYEARLAVADAALEAAKLSEETSRVRISLARQVRQGAAADLELARREHARAEALVRDGSATPTELDEAAARLRRAETSDATALTGIELAEQASREASGQVRLREKEAVLARTDLAYTRLTSEVGGVVVRRLSEPGSHATAGIPILEIHDAEDLRLDVALRESLAPGLDRGREYAVRIPALGDGVPARIVEVVPSAEEGSRSVRVRFGLPPRPGLLPGMSGSVALAVGTRRATVVPEETLVRAGQLAFVDVVTDGGPVRRFVRPGLAAPGGGIEILDGLRPGEVVAIAAAERGDGR